MADSILDAISYFQQLPDTAGRAAVLAINQVARRGALSLIKSDIMSEVSFPKDYLTDDRLGITKLASASSLEATITARHRPTSLARFASGQELGSKRKLGVVVNVGVRGARVMRNAWLVRLTRGEPGSQDGFNIGLAVRVKPGESVPNKKGQQMTWLVPNQVALLYGPSVDQVFQEVSGKVVEPVSEMVVDEFLRQFTRLL